MRSDNTSGAGIVVDLAHSHVHDGRAYEVSYKTPDGSQLADNANLDILFRSNSEHIHFSYGPVAANPIEVLFYEAPTVTSTGTGLSVVGMNRDRSISPGSTVFRAPTLTAVGNLLANTLQVWGLAPLTPAFPELPWILRKNTDYLIRITNRGGGAQDVGIVIQWFEEDI